ncbi:hypothetical protein ACFONL_01510 [Camelimonas fluminis]|uniref:Uncharacterized protein n=1 Tax=Camelimonas fluminis TaxID=1576911 RepID=A0ABV7UBP5_9HYPH|nr:hypothetical protein [Camelimonas fluminis]
MSFPIDHRKQAAESPDAFAVPEQAAITVQPAKTKIYDRPYMPMSEYIAMHKAAGTYQPKPRDPNAPAKTEAVTDATDGAAKARKPVSEAQRRFYAGYHARKRAAAAQSAA